MFGGSVSKTGFLSFFKVWQSFLEKPPGLGVWGCLRRKVFDYNMDPSVSLGCSGSFPPE